MENRVTVGSRLAKAVANCEVGLTQLGFTPNTFLSWIWWWIYTTLGLRYSHQDFYLAALKCRARRIPCTHHAKLLGLKLLQAEDGMAVVEFVAGKRLNFFGLILIYTRTYGGQMNNFIENHTDQFANGHVSCDLRGKSDAAKSQTQFDAANVIERGAAVAPEEFTAPIGKLLGLMIRSSGAGRATVDFEASGRYANPMGTLHGGVLADLADAAMGVAYRSTLAEGDTFTTIELKINFLRPVWNAKLRAQARMVRAGKVVGLIECDAFDER